MGAHQFESVLVRQVSGSDDEASHLFHMLCLVELGGVSPWALRFEARVRGLTPPESPDSDFIPQFKAEVVLVLLV